jgi:hypothetical protein
VLKDHTAGDPQDEKIIWTDLNCTEIAEKLRKAGIKAGRKVIKKLLKKYGYKKRKIQKRLAGGQSENRNEQFEKIARLKEEYIESKNPVISVDGKKKEPLGQLYRAGEIYSQEEQKSFDHDWSHLAKGIVIPHGIYDLKKNTGYINIGTSAETAEFACESIKIWWSLQGCLDYPNATSILMLMDGGGSNSSRHYVFKEALQRLANEIGIEIRVAHYPPYTSKWNPIEHRLFPHITRSMQGIMLKDHEMAKQLIEKTTTKTGLKVRANIINKVYEKGKKAAKEFKENMKIKFDEYLGQWNYRALPLQV